MEEGRLGDYGDDSDQQSEKCKDLIKRYNAARAAVQFGRDPNADIELGTIRKEMEEAKCTMKESVNEEDLNESFLPKGRDIRSAAREMTYNKLLKKWAK